MHIHVQSFFREICRAILSSPGRRGAATIVGAGLLTCALYGYAQMSVEKAIAPLELQIAKLQQTQKRSAKKPESSPWLLSQDNENKKTRIIYKRGMHVPHLKSLIASVVDYLELPDKRDWERLILLTIVVESDCGYYTKQIRGPAKGIAQLETPTEQDVHIFLKAKMPELHKKVRRLRFPARLGVHEAEINAAYAIAMCAGEYLRRGYSPKGKTTLELAQAWKRFYNTHLGKGTVKKAMAMLAERKLKI